MNLIINLGLKSIRGIIFTEGGEQVYSKSYPVHTSLFKSHVEQDANEWKDLLENILNNISVNTDLSNEIKFITATTSSSCIYGVDESINPITKVLMVSDKRAEEETNFIKSLSGYKETPGLFCSSSAVVPKALWFKKHHSETFGKVRYWLGAGEMINHYFTGEIFTDALNAGKAFYHDGRYATNVLKQVGLSVDTLPKVYEIGKIFSVQNSLIKKFSLAVDCKYVLTTYDAICAVLGSSNGNSRNACDVSGTVTSVRVLTNESISNDTQDRILVQPLDFVSRKMIGASNNLGGGIIEWFKQSYFADADEGVYHLMENLAQQSSVGSGGIIFLPFLLGERAPFSAPNASGTFFGINRGSTLKDFTRAAFESTAYVTRHLTEFIEKSGVTVDSLSVSGGLARFDTINQIKADVCNKPVHVVENFESTSIGAYILMAISNKTFGSLDEAVKTCVKIRKTIYPSDKVHKYYDQYFKLYELLNQKLMPVYDMQKEILNSKIIHESEIMRNL